MLDLTCFVHKLLSGFQVSYFFFFHFSFLFGSGTGYKYGVKVRRGEHMQCKAWSPKVVCDLKWVHISTCSSSKCTTYLNESHSRESMSTISRIHEIFIFILKIARSISYVSSVGFAKVFM